MAGKSPGIFFRQQFSLDDFVTFTIFYQRVVYLSSSLYRKMIKDHWVWILDFTDQYDALKIKGTTIMMSAFNFDKKIYILKICQFTINICGKDC